MAQFIPLMLVGAAGYYVSNLPRIQNYSEPVHFLNKEVPDYGEPVYPQETNYNLELDEMERNGISYSVAKASDLSMVNINDAWKPYGPPRQMGIKPGKIHDLYRNEAERNAYVRTYGMAPFVRRNEMEIPVGKAQQSNMNITIPSSKLPKDNPFHALQFYPRVYIDEENWDTNLQLADPEFKVWGSNQWPSEWLPGENHDDEGRFSYWLNPWGLNGNYLNLFRQQHAAKTRSELPNLPQDSIVRPNTIYYRY